MSRLSTFVNNNSSFFAKTLDNTLNTSNLSLISLQKKTDDIIFHHEKLQNKWDVEELERIFLHINKPTWVDKLEDFGIKFEQAFNNIQACLTKLSTLTPTTNNYIDYLQLIKNFHEAGSSCNELYRQYKNEMHEIQRLTDSVKLLFKNSNLEETLRAHYQTIINVLQNCFHQLGYPVLTNAELHNPAKLFNTYKNWIEAIELSLIPAWSTSMTQKNITQEEITYLRTQLEVAGQTVRLYKILVKFETQKNKLWDPIRTHLAYREFIDEIVWAQFEIASQKINNLLCNIARYHNQNGNASVSPQTLERDGYSELSTWLKRIVHDFKQAPLQGTRLKIPHEEKLVETASNTYAIK